MPSPGRRRADRSRTAANVFGRLRHRSSVGARPTAGGIAGSRQGHPRSRVRTGIQAGLNFTRTTYWRKTSEEAPLFRVRARPDSSPPCSNALYVSPSLPFPPGRAHFFGGSAPRNERDSSQALDCKWIHENSEQLMNRTHEFSTEFTWTSRCFPHTLSGS